MISDTKRLFNAVNQCVGFRIAIRSKLPAIIKELNRAGMVHSIEARRMITDLILKHCDLPEVMRANKSRLFNVAKLVLNEHTDKYYVASSGVPDLQRMEDPLRIDIQYAQFPLIYGAPEITVEQGKQRTGEGSKMVYDTEKLIASLKSAKAACERLVAESRANLEVAITSAADELLQKNKVRLQPIMRPVSLDFELRYDQLIATLENAANDSVELSMPDSKLEILLTLPQTLMVPGSVSIEFGLNT